MEENESGFQSYTKLEKIGSGAYGVVYKALDKKTNQYVAMKKSLLDFSQAGIPPTSLREASLLRELCHPNIVRFFINPYIIISLQDILLFNKKLYFIFEYLECDLKQFIESTYDPTRNKYLLYNILTGISECHQHKIMHRDIKPSNILITHNQIAKIADFGLARPYQRLYNPFTAEVVTLWYRAPELLLGAPTYSNKIDIWAIGCIFAELQTKQPLFPGDSEIDQLYRIFRLLGTPTEAIWPGVTSFKNYKLTFPMWKEQNLTQAIPQLKLEETALDLLKKMIIFDPQIRISAEEALIHVKLFKMNDYCQPYFEEIKLD